MSPKFSFNNWDQPLTGQDLNLDSEITNKIIHPMRVGGAIPVSPTLVAELRRVKLESRSAITTLTTILCGDPFAAIRMLSVANSVVFARGRAVTSLAQALPLVGLGRIADEVANLGPRAGLQSYLHRSAVGAFTYQDLTLVAVMAQSLASSYRLPAELVERAPTLATIRMLGRALTALIEPEIFAVARLDEMIDRHRGVDKGLKKLIKKSPGEFGAAIAQKLSLPKEIVNLLPELDVAPWLKRTYGEYDSKDMRLMLQCAYVAGLLVDELRLGVDYRTFDDRIKDCSERCDWNPDRTRELLGTLLERYSAALKINEVSLVRLPSYLSRYTDSIVDRTGKIVAFSASWAPLSERLNLTLHSLKKCLSGKAKGRTVPQLPLGIVTTLEGLVRTLPFDRACFLINDRKERVLRRGAMVGSVPEVWAGWQRSLNTPDPHAPDLVCIREKRPVFQGDGLFGDEWPFVAFPAFVGSDLIGVFYAECVPIRADGLSIEEQMACIAVAELWHDVPAAVNQVVEEED